ncbi:lipoprotein [Bacillus solitudinis]|uniref:hypothetical protein n=1 Tax=Bacillus solitudinis TaxID=2014074 RepID=UPI000C248AB1|nr:hypothetical protein [Bacillus solitudinis]
MKQVLRWFALITVALGLTACGGDEVETIKIAFYSGLSHDLADDIEVMVGNGLGEMVEEPTIELHPGMYERLIVDLATHEGDLLILREELMSMAFDSEGLIPLDAAIDEAFFSQISSRYKDVNEETGEQHVYAIPLENDSLFLRELGVELEEPLIAIVPIFSDYYDEAIEVIAHLAQKEE